MWKQKHMLWLVAGMLLLTACQKSPDPGVREPSVSAPEAFAYAEVQAVLGMTEEEIGALFGEPLDTRDDGDVRIVTYADATVIFGDGYIARLEVRSDALPCIRDIKTGDSVETVCSRFPDEGNDFVYPEEEEPHNYKVLYGEYVHMSAYGVLHRQGETVDALELADEDFGLTFAFAEGKLHSVIYAVSA